MIYQSSDFTDRKCYAFKRRKHVLPSYSSIRLVCRAFGLDFESTLQIIITFALPFLLDNAALASQAKLPVKHTTFVRIVKNTSWTSWGSSEIASTNESLSAAGAELSIKMYITHDDSFTTGKADQVKESDYTCWRNLSQRFCVNIESDNAAARKWLMNTTSC
jgi:hypothetical protein